MRKLFLISALLLVSASAQAGERVLALGVLDTPAAASTDSKPLSSTAQSDSAKPQANEPTAQPRSPKPRSQARRNDDDDEAKARRIAAKYGISW